MIELSLDLNKSIKSFKNRVVVRQGDIGEKVLISIYDNKKPIDLTEQQKVKLEGNLKNGDYVEGEANPYNSEKGKYILRFQSKNVSIIGKYQRAFLRIYDENDNRISSEEVHIEVLKDADISRSQATTYVSKLDNLLENMDQEFDSFMDDKESDYAKIDQKCDELGSELTTIKNESTEIKKTQSDILQSIKDNDLATKTELEIAKQDSSANVIYQILGKDITEITFTLNFKNKKTNSLVENPNKARASANNNLITPTTVLNDYSQERYNSVSEIDKNYMAIWLETANQRAQSLFEFAILEEVIRHLGVDFFELQGLTTLKDQTTFLRSKMTNIQSDIWGKGVSQKGNKFYYTTFDNRGNNWGSLVTNESNTVEKTSLIISQSDLEIYLSDSGNMYFLAYSEPTDGTLATQLYIDYVELSFKLRVSTRDVIESMIAANQVESIATGEEAEEGKTDEKLMTPLKTKEFYLNETKARRQKWDEGLNWIAHRGNNTDYPENSILAFQQAKRHWGIETDIQVTSDGKWVVMHDSTVDRTTNGTGTVASKTLAQFRELRIDTGANLSALTDADKIPPTLEEYLLICKQLNKVPVIEIKTGNYTTAHYTLLKDTLSLFGYDETNCVIASFDYVVLGKVRAMYRNMELHYFVNDISSNVINQLSALGIPAACSCSHSNNSLNAENIKLLHAVGLKVAAWTVPEDKFDSLISLGVDYITTNSLSGNLKFAMLELVNGFVNNLDSGMIRGSYCEEIGGGRCSLVFNVQEAPTINSKGTPFAKLPNWAFPMYRTYENCTIRTSTGVTLGTFDINGRQVPASATVGTLGIGLNWTDRTHWAAGSTTYKV